MHKGKQQEKEESVAIGQITISQNLPRQTVLCHLTPQNKSFIKSAIWDLSRLQYTTLHCHKLLAIAKTCTITQLNLWDNKRPTILQQISHVRWPNLVVLSLPSNQIVSIEGLSRCWLTAVEYLDLSNNFVSDFRTVCRLYAPVLSTLQVIHNPARSLGEGLCRMECGGLSGLDMMGDVIARGDIRWVVKCNYARKGRNKSTNTSGYDKGRRQYSYKKVETTIMVDRSRVQNWINVLQQRGRKLPFQIQLIG